jgi:hypothetical protein
MSIQRAVSDFMTHSQNLYHRLRSNGEALSDVELMALREQLHLLDTEAGHLQDLKFRSEGTHFIFDGRRPHDAKQLSRRKAA